MAVTKTARASILARLPIFSDLSEIELKFIADRAVIKRYAAGELIFGEGDPCACRASTFRGAERTLNVRYNHRFGSAELPPGG
jgi:hypothetical protein